MYEVAPGSAVTETAILANSGSGARCFKERE
jgi:hypothetical protein